MTRTRTRRNAAPQGPALFAVDALTTSQCPCGCGTIERIRLDGHLNTCPCLAVFAGDDCRADKAPTVRGRGPATFTYYLGGRPNWLTAPELIDQDVPLFIAAPTLARYKTRGEAFPLRRWGRWALDSGAFMALTTKGADDVHPWHMDADDYGSFVVRLVDDLGMPDFAAPQDWPCEPKVRKRTGLTVREHIELTVANFVHLRENFPMIPWIPVLQGWDAADYLYCADLYEANGVDLASYERVGVGSICRRAHVPSIVAVIELFAGRGYRMHAFGVKTTALPVIGHLLASADSYAWSENARKNNHMHAGCDHRSKPNADGVTVPTDCRNCPRWAVEWRRRVLAKLRPAGPTRRELALAA